MLEEIVFRVQQCPGKEWSVQDYESILLNEVNFVFLPSDRWLRIGVDVDCNTWTGSEFLWQRRASQLFVQRYDKGVAWCLRRGQDGSCELKQDGRATVVALEQVKKAARELTIDVSNGKL